MSGSNGAHRRYRVETIGSARESFLDIVQRANELDVGIPILEAFRAVIGRLSHGPREFGEPMYHLRAMRMEVRKAAIDPLYVEFGVHETESLVVIRRIRWLNDPQI